MEQGYDGIIIGGIISFVSLIVGILLTNIFHWFQFKKQRESESINWKRDKDIEIITSLLKMFYSLPKSAPTSGEISEWGHQLNKSNFPLVQIFLGGETYDFLLDKINQLIKKRMEYKTITLDLDGTSDENKILKAGNEFMGVLSSSILEIEEYFQNYLKKKYPEFKQ